MAPSKAKKSKASILNDWHEYVSSRGVTLDSLDERVLQKAYGLLPPTKLFASDTAFLRDCSNRFVDRVEASSSSASVRGRSSSVESVVIVDDDDLGVGTSTGRRLSKGSGDESDDEPVKPQSRSKKGKGKAKEDQCGGVKCRNNPKCLNMLGQDKWHDADKAFKAFKKAKDFTPTAALDRDKDLPVGLRNLGATCYVNSFLQVWYQDEMFRRAVYACDPPADGKVDVSPLFQLQVLFAFLQTGCLASYDPEPLVTSLKLNVTEQQDAQEFSKLFMERLDYEFKAQGERDAVAGRKSAIDVSKLVETQFEGRMTYGTQCLHCKQKTSNSSIFRELEISLAKECSLEDQITASLADEYLRDDNQYFCEHCQKKRDAKRYTQLESLPPVLHFSILRFVFNMKTLTRKKATEAIHYPLRINMGRYLPQDASGKRPEVWYQLKGVLLHKGASAHHGHYTANVHDSRRDKWFSFDDDTVHGIDALNDEEGEAGEDKPAKGKKKKATPGFTRTLQGGLRPKSKDAYMLVYTLERNPAAGQEGEPEPPALAQFRIEQMQSEHEKNKAKDEETQVLVSPSCGVTAYRIGHSQRKIEEDFRRLRDEKRSVYTVWKARDGEDGSYLVGAAALSNWIEQGWPVKPQQLRLIVKDETETDKTTAAQSEATNEQEVEVEDSGYHKMAVDDAHEEIKTNGHEAVPNARAQPRIDNSAILCEHGLANPAEAESIKRISQAGFDALSQLGVRVEPVLPVPASLCTLCVQDMLKDQDYRVRHIQQVNEFDFVSKDSKGAVWISKPWLSDWLEDFPRKIHKSGRDADESPAAFQDDVVCHHGALVPSQKKRMPLCVEAASLLQSIFPDWNPPSADIVECQDCRADDAEAGREKKATGAQIRKEKARLQSFQQSHIVNFMSRNDTYFAVPSAWAKAWRAWAEKTKTPETRPGDVDNSVLLCEHGLLAVDLDRERDHRGEVTLMPQLEFDFLRENYQVDPVIECTLTDSKVPTIASVPGRCENCLDAKRKSFEEAEITVKTISSDDLDEKGNRKAETKSEQSDDEISMLPGAFGGKKTARQASMFAPRQSSRLSSKSSSGTKRSRGVRAPKRLTVRKDDTVKRVKMAISESVGTPTIYQRLFFGGRELDDMEETVAKIGIVPGDTIELFEVEAHDDDIDLSQLSDAELDENGVPIGLSGPAAKKRRAAVEGFSGTGLYGWNASVVPSASKANTAAGEADPKGDVKELKPRMQDEQADVSMVDSAQLECPHCTFLQPIPQTTEASCEMCDQPLLA